MSSWARASTSLSLILLAVFAAAGSFGRFGWSKLPVAPGFQFSETGFSADVDSADELRWPSRVEWKIEDLSDRHARYVPTAAGPLLRLESNLRAPGFVAVFSGKAVLTSSVLVEPILTIKEASFGSGIAVPESNWVLVSMGPGQPPILATGLDKPIRAMVTGGPGRWTLAFEGPSRFRFSLPRGLTALPDRTAGTLGKLASVVESEYGYWGSEAPVLLGMDVAEEGGSLVVRWSFDRAGAIVPPAVVLSKEARIPIQVSSLVRTVAAPLTDGPTAFCDEPVLVVRFPYFPFAAGSPLVRDLPNSLGTMTPAQVLLGALFSGVVDAEAVREARESLAGTIERTAQPATGVPLGYQGDGKGSFAVALLALARRLRSNPGEDTNPSRNELLWAMDPRSLTLWLEGSEPMDAATVLALELSMEQTNERRVLGAMLACGVVARGALPEYWSKYGLRRQDAPRSRLEPLARRLAGLPQGDAWVKALDSPLRVQASTPVRLGVGSLLRVRVPSSAPSSLVLYSPSKLTIESAEPGTSVKLTGTVNFNEVVVQRASPGEAVLKLSMDRWEKQVPAWPGWPSWLPSPH